LPWFAVAYGGGIVLYFTAEREPALWAGAALAGLSTLAALLLRRRTVAHVVALGALALCLGFAVATFKTSLIDHPVLPFATSGVTVTGFVELREESQHTDRFVLRVEHIEGGRIDALAEDKPQRVRLSVKRGMAPPAGSFVEVKASLDPPLQPLEPGSYDFARDLFFQKIGASGFVRGAVKIISEPAPQTVLQRADAFVQRLRDAIDARIRAVLPGDKGAIAAMLIDGKRDAIAPNVYDALFVSGIGHVLSISGYHMAVVAGVIFFIVRAFFALIPGLAERAPIKKWAACAALQVTAFYLVLSGNQVATQRSFIMIAVVLVGVLLDRPTLTMRTLTIAALAVLSFAPESIVHPSFQMSFAATLALIAGYERGTIKISAATNTSLGARGAVGRERDHRPHSRVLARRARHHALRGLSLPPDRALRRAGQSARHADRLGLGHADGDTRRDHDAAWPRCRILAADGLRHRMDERSRLMGGKSAWRLRPGHRVRRRTSLADDRRPAGHRPIENAVALDRRLAARSGDRCRRLGTAARCARRRRWPRLRGARRGRKACSASHRQ
jgi:competence protein ComEC